MVCHLWGTCLPSPIIAPMDASARSSSAMQSYRGESKVAASTRKDKTSECAKNMAQRKHVAVQKASQPVTAGNLMRGPAFIFPSNQYQTSTNQYGPSKPATSTSKASYLCNLSFGRKLARESFCEELDQGSCWFCTMRVTPSTRLGAGIRKN